MKKQDYINSLVGKKVVREFQLQQGDEVRNAKEVGVIVYAWWDRNMELIDCYIAFHGETFLKGVPTIKPYVLRYFLDGLEIIDE